MDLSILNENQKEAVVTTEGPIMVMAGAGSGKTRVLTYRLAYLVSELGINPSSILAVTFTNKAAKEMKERIGKLLGYDVNKMWVSTFHSFGARFLRREIRCLPNYRNDFVIIDEDDAKKICKEEIKKNDLHLTPKDALSWISNLKNEEDMPELSPFDRREFDILWDSYQKHLQQENLLDFDDLLLLTVRILEKNPLIKEKYNQLFNYVMIDEFQDTNRIQYKLINLLCEKHQNIFIVGDINQSIYSFRGARIENVSLFKNLYHPKIIKLEQNYRSTKNILEVANKIIKKNDSCVHMELYTDGVLGEKIKYYRSDSNYGEVLFVIKEIKNLLNKGYKYKDIAILYRLNSLSLNFENEFVKNNIPYIIYGGVGYYERKEVKDIIAYLRLILNSDDNFSFKRIVNMPKRKIGEKQLKTLEEDSKLYHSSLYDAIKYSNNNLLLNFSYMIESLKEDLEKENLDVLIDKILEKTNYMVMLQNNEEDDRIDNVLELKSIMKDVMESYEGTNTEKLTAFLQDLALRTDTDNIEENDDKVKLMSFHQAKGLEYKVVFMVAMEQGIFPSVRSFGNIKDEEEERRICYVGITRAMERLYLTNAQSRRIYGMDQQGVPSTYIKDIIHLDSLEDLSIKPYKDKLRQAVKTFNPPIHSNKTRPHRTVVEKTNNHRFNLGDKLMHKAFGQGMVVGYDGDFIKVAFPSPIGIKTLMEDHPSITKL